MFCQNAVEMNNESQSSELLLVTFAIIISAAILTLCCTCCRRFHKIPRAQPQDQNVFNISSRVQGQEQRHPDAFVSLEHITIMNELNKPPKYDDAPPSYEEAIKIAMAQDNSLKTFQTEVAASQGTSSSSSAAATSSAATPQIQPAIPNRTE
ncbi:uncharacterized protein LOC143201430 isoform X6 [Rhynchophorus ferrugineus]|uniref:uncharacterized protein LOC143201430 isoform X6 n=1 Tax=Rhynchophorus ferrugineus TaxID=354439 RepID=UPI003FCEA8D3